MLSTCHFFSFQLIIFVKRTIYAVSQAAGVRVGDMLVSVHNSVAETPRSLAAGLRAQGLAQSGKLVVVKVGWALRGAFFRSLLLSPPKNESFYGRGARNKIASSNRSESFLSSKKQSYGICESTALLLTFQYTGDISSEIQNRNVVTQIFLQLPPLGTNQREISGPKCATPADNGVTPLEGTRRRLRCGAQSTG